MATRRTGDETDWRPRLSAYKPNVPEGAIRNLRPLFSDQAARVVALEATLMAARRDLAFFDGLFVTDTEPERRKALIERGFEIEFQLRTANTIARIDLVLEEGGLTRVRRKV